MTNPPTPHPTLEETAIRAGYWHAGQVDKAGQPYIGHLIRVSRHLLRRFPDSSETERHAAWLHDVLEDTEVTANDLTALGYTPEIIETVAAVTKSPGSETYAERIERLASHAPLSALRVKLADLSDNSDPQRLAALPEAKARSLAARYGSAMIRLEAALSERAVPRAAPGSSQPE